MPAGRWAREGDNSVGAVETVDNSSAGIHEIARRHCGAGPRHAGSCVSWHRIPLLGGLTTIACLTRIRCAPATWLQHDKLDPRACGRTSPMSDSRPGERKGSRCRLKIKSARSTVARISRSGSTSGRLRTRRCISARGTPKCSERQSIVEARSVRHPPPADPRTSHEPRRRRIGQTPHRRSRRVRAPLHRA